MPMDVATHAALKLDQPTPLEVNGRSNADIRASLDHPDDAIYAPCPEASAAQDVPEGEVASFEDWRSSRQFPATVRDLWIYQTPAPEPQPHNLLVFQDGALYLNPRGPVRVCQVLDSLYASADIGPTVAVFVNPGRPPGSAPMFDPRGYDEANQQRSYEYDSVTPDYANFLQRDLLPFVSEHIVGTLSDAPERRLLAGISSGGICAFNAAWQAPEQFGCVLSHCGSFTNIRGGHNLQYLVRATPRKPLRVFLQSGKQDAETLYGNWPLANQTLADSLRYAGYEYRFEFGQGGHTLRHGGALFAESLKWLLPTHN